MRLPILAAILNLPLLFLSTESYGYNIYRDCGQTNGSFEMKWQSPTINYNVRESHFTIFEYFSILAGANEFNKVLGSDVDVNTAYTSNSSYFFGNGVNETYKVWANWPNNNGTIAYAKYSYVNGFSNNCSGITNQGFLIEGDAWFNPTTNFVTDNGAFTSNSGPHIGRVAVHEYGHLAGHIGRNITESGVPTTQFSSHEGDVVTTMNTGGGVSGGGVLGGNSNGSNLGTFRNKLHADDAAFLRKLYPDSTTGYDVSGSRWKDGSGLSGVVENVYAGNLGLKRGQGFMVPYTIQNQSTYSVDVKVEVWMTQDGVLDGLGSDILLTNNGGPLYHLYTMNPDGHIPGTPVNTSNSSTIEGNIWVVIPNNASQFPNGSWTIGYHVSMPYLPAGTSDIDPNDNWVAFKALHVLSGN